MNEKPDSMAPAATKRPNGERGGVTTPSPRHQSTFQPAPHPQADLPSVL